MKNKKSNSRCLLLTILSVLLILTCFSGCGNKKETSLKLSDDLPEFVIRGNYSKGELEVYEDEGYEMLWSYIGDDNAEYRYVRGYKWPSKGKSLIEEAEEDAKYYYPNLEPEVIVSDFWNEPHDLEYAYYVGVKEDKDIMYQVWTFLENDFFYQIVVGYDLVTYTIDKANVKFSLPRRLTEVKTDTADKAFIDPDYKNGMAEFPNIEIHINSLDSEYTKEVIEKKWEVENVEVKEQSYVDDFDNVHHGYAVYCEYQEDGKTIACDEFLIELNGSYFGIEFLYDKDLEYVDYMKNCYDAFLYTIEEY